MVMEQVATNSPETAMLGGFKQAVDDAIFGSSAAHQNQMLQLLGSTDRSEKFYGLVLELLLTRNQMVASSDSRA